MITFWHFLIAFFCYTTLASALDEPCIQGALVMEDCNTCVCADTGRFACTLRTCYQGPQFVDTENDPIAVRPFSKRQTSPKYSEPCSAGQSYEEDCNTCTCTDSGRFACTLRACYHGPQFPDTVEAKAPVPVRPLRKRQTTKLSEPCSLGQSYEEDCNTCSCTDTGKFVCTRRACYHGPLFPDTVDTPTPAKALRKRQNEPCEPGHAFERDCNTCTCTSTRIYACTRRACIDLPK